MELEQSPPAPKITFQNLDRPSVFCDGVCYGRNYDDLIKRLLEKISGLEEEVHLLKANIEELKSK